MQYRVHIYATVRVPVVVEAESQEEAISKTDEAVDLHELLSQPVFINCSGIMEHSEYAEDIESYLVDEIGDTEYKNTREYDKHGHLVLQANYAATTKLGGV